MEAALRTARAEQARIAASAAESERVAQAAIAEAETSRRQAEASRRQLEELRNELEGTKRARDAAVVQAASALQAAPSRDRPDYAARVALLEGQLQQQAMRLQQRDIDYAGRVALLEGQLQQKDIEAAEGVQLRGQMQAQAAQLSALGAETVTLRSQHMQLGWALPT